MGSGAVSQTLYKQSSQPKKQERTETALVKNPGKRKQVWKRKTKQEKIEMKIMEKIFPEQKCWGIKTNEMEICRTVQKMKKELKIFLAALLAAGLFCLGIASAVSLV